MTFETLPKNYWVIIEQFLPDYYNRDEVLISSLLKKHSEGELEDKNDICWIEENYEDSLTGHKELEIKLYLEAVEVREKKDRTSKIMKEYYENFVQD